MRQSASVFWNQKTGCHCDSQLCQQNPCCFFYVRCFFRVFSGEWPRYGISLWLGALDFLTFTLSCTCLNQSVDTLVAFGLACWLMVVLLINQILHHCRMFVPLFVHKDGEPRSIFHRQSFAIGLPPPGGTTSHSGCRPMATRHFSDFTQMEKQKCQPVRFSTQF